eukprot:CAMPEP_0172442422 /NCGR_PEP_ID=MMETSP1065-20121228/2848_1 /TAXON_ID=265537 /ORGANISM="Amphiprora paludosa, Strain CCMP125" /LENGTH=149 /DNA_ID=CAMNT_0013192263 /DNA_START=93 /DNA_END=542 /DNA_ORIENTATION=+
MFRFAVLALFLASAQAFLAPMPSFVARPSTARQVILSESEVESIMQSASDCAEGECSLEDVNELIFELQEQQKIMQSRLDKTMNMIADLQSLNGKTQDRDEVRAFVKDMLRVFSHDKPNFPVSGFSGDVGKGSQTAWDVLPPKKWTPSP